VGFAAFAGEPVAIGTLLWSSSSYDHHIVTIQGIARQVELYPPLSPSHSVCRVLYDAYIFTLEDETGSVQVNVPGHCVPGMVIPVSSGNKVVVEGVFHVISKDARGVMRSSPQFEAKNIRELAD
jgi:hypothetical protein